MSVFQQSENVNREILQYLNAVSRGDDVTAHDNAWALKFCLIVQHN